MQELTLSIMASSLDPLAEIQPVIAVKPSIVCTSTQ
jgi:hypothetical protein